MTPSRPAGRKDEVFGKGRGRQSHAKTGAQMVIVTRKERSANGKVVFRGTQDKLI